MESPGNVLFKEMQKTYEDSLQEYNRRFVNRMIEASLKGDNYINMEIKEISIVDALINHFRSDKLTITYTKTILYVSWEWETIDWKSLRL